MERDIPDARATAATPPRPSPRANEPANTRRCRSSNNGNTTANTDPNRSSLSSTPTPYNARLNHSWTLTKLIIESRDDHAGGLGPQDARDLRTIRNYLRPWRGSPTFDWHGKEDRLLWTADAAAGAVREHAEGTDSRWMTQLIDSGVPVRLTWIGPTG